MVRFLLWRLLGALAAVLAMVIVAWLLSGAPGALMRGEHHARALHLSLSVVAGAIARWAAAIGHATRPGGGVPAWLLPGSLCAWSLAIATARARERRRRRYVRLAIDVYRTDRAPAEAVVTMFGALHKRLLRRWWRRLWLGQPAVALEVHHRVAAPPGGADEGPQRRSPPLPAAWFAVSCPLGTEAVVEAAIRGAYPNCRLRAADRTIGAPPAVLRLKKQGSFIRRSKVLDHFEQEREPPVNRLLTVMGACGEPAFVQLAITPAPALFERLAKHVFKHREAELSRARRQHDQIRDRSMVEDAELRGGLDVQHRALFFADIRVVATTRRACEQIASELRTETAENRLVERGTAIRHGLLGLYTRRVQRGEGNPLPSFHRGVFASTELAAIWQLPSSDYATVPLARTGVPLAPAPPGVYRPADGSGVLRDALGPISIHPELRRQNTAVPGTVEQGKSSFLVASIAEDLQRDRCAVIVLDPKGDAADAALSLVPPERTCTFLDLSNPTCGFNPLAAAAPADVIADYVVGALKNLFTDADIRASSDRYLRNAIIAVLAYDRRSSLWDAARLLSVGEEGYSYRRSVGARLRTLPDFKEISAFFTAELTAQLADSRSTTTAKLDAPVNKLARLLNSPSIKRVLLNESLRIDFDQVIAGQEVLVVKGALGAVGAGNTSVLMQLLVGMLDASLSRQQDLTPAERRVAVALKIDEAPLVLNRGFAETMALKRSAGLETVACWQTDAQWVDRDVREQLDALFAHRVYFATASARDARAAVPLTMAEFSDTIRPGISHLSTLGHPDVRLHLPKHHAIVSLTTPTGRQPAFVAQTIPLEVDLARIALHAGRQHERGGRHMTDLRQPHWERAAPDAHEGRAGAGAQPPGVRAVPAVQRPPGPNGKAGEPGSTPADSYAELVQLDSAQSVRWAQRTRSVVQLQPDRLDLEILALVAEMRHVLSSQIHRRFNPSRAATTTQRRLKRLSDAGLVERLQFHRRDGGGVPMCYVISDDGLRALEAHEPEEAGPGIAANIEASPARTGAFAADRERRLRQARRDVHVAGWVFALERATGRTCSLRGPSRSVLVAPERSTGDGRSAIGPGDLRLPGGRVPHDFLRTAPAGGLIELERFETLRPHAIVELPGIDVMVELDDRLPVGRAAAKLERYDHFLTGWAEHTRRYGRRVEAVPSVVFVCRDRSRARQLATGADSVLRACRAYPGEYPFDWEYLGRQRILFASERDIHEGLLSAYGVPTLPPAVRVAAAHGDPSAAEATAEPREMVLEALKGAAGTAGTGRSQG